MNNDRRTTRNQKATRRGRMVASWLSTVLVLLGGLSSTTGFTGGMGHGPIRHGNTNLARTGLNYPRVFPLVVPATIDISKQEQQQQQQSRAGRSRGDSSSTELGLMCGNLREQEEGVLCFPTLSANRHHNDHHNHKRNGYRSNSASRNIPSRPGFRSRMLHRLFDSNTNNYLDYLDSISGKGYYIYFMPRPAPPLPVVNGETDTDTAPTSKDDADDTPSMKEAVQSIVKKGDGLLGKVASQRFM